MAMEVAMEAVEVEEERTGRRRRRGQSRGTACGGAECRPEKEGDVEDGEREGRERRNREKESESE